MDLIRKRNGDVIDEVKNDLEATRDDPVSTTIYSGHTDNTDPFSSETELIDMADNSSPDSTRNLVLTMPLLMLFFNVFML